MRLCCKSVFCLLLGFLLIGAQTKARAPSIVYLTWMHDPTTTMTIHWQTTDKDLISKIEYRKKGDEQWQVKDGIYAALQKTNILVHTVELDELSSNADYQFRIAAMRGTYQFRTLPQKLIDRFVSWWAAMLIFIFRRCIK